jgi:hypothetical protein
MKQQTKTGSKLALFGGMGKAKDLTFPKNNRENSSIMRMHVDNSEIFTETLNKELLQSADVQNQIS